MIRYGLIVHDEQNSAWRNGDTYLPTTVNIGDYIQSIAARQFLPRVDCFIERENVRYFTGEPTKVIMNGWWRIFDGNALASKAIIPLYTSYHISYISEVTDETLRHLQQHQPIGCRDANTLNFLLEHGIDAYFSACLTLTLGKTYPKCSCAENKVVFSDVDFPAKADSDEKQQHLSNIVCELLHGANFTAERLNHSLPIRHTSHEERLAVADRYLKTFAEASLVVTSRLHAALPCIGMGVPVLFCFDRYDRYRYQQLIELMNYAGYKNGEFVCDYIVRQKSAGGSTSCALVNPQRHIPYMEFLSSTVEKFVGE